MNAREPVYVHCPYCGEPLEWLVDCTVEAQQYIEDCAVCCRPIDVTVQIRNEDGLPRLTLRRQDET